MNFAEGDYVEHWENGIGKVVRVSESSIAIDFMNRGKTEVPIERTKFLKKLNPQGLWARLFENHDDVRKLVEEDPAETIKLLIRDLDPAHGKKIGRAHLKTLLTLALPDDRGWRRDFSLVQNWESWWKSAAKKLKDDPWIDMSRKEVFALREEPISKAETLQNQFLKETNLYKKILVSEQLLKVCDNVEHRAILSDIRDFLEGLFRTSGAMEFLADAVHNAINLQSKGFQVPGFDDNSYLLSLRALLQKTLSSEKLLTLYRFFCKLPNQNPNDHLILFLYGDKRIRTEVARYFRKKDGLNRARSDSSKKVLTPNQLQSLNKYRSDVEEVLSQAVKEMYTHIPDPFPSVFFLAIMLSPDINERLKGVVATSIAKERRETTIYQYLLKVEASPHKESIPFLYNFLKAIGTTKAEWAFRNILLTQATASQRPSVYVEAFKLLVSDSEAVINAEDKNPLLHEVKKLLSTDVTGAYKDLLVQISNIGSTLPDFEELSGTLSDEALFNIAKTRQGGIRRRKEALKLLAARGLTSECLLLAQALVDMIQPEEFLLLQEIVRCPIDTVSFKNLLLLLLQNCDMSNAELRHGFVSFVKMPEILKIFLETVLLDQHHDCQDKTQEKLRQIFAKDKSLTKELIRFGLEKMITEAEPPSNIKANFIVYLSPFMNEIIGEMRFMAIENALSSKADRESLVERHAMEIRDQEAEFEATLHDAMTRTSQRYEEYLKRLIPVSDQIKAIEQNLDSNESINNDIRDKLTVVREDIEGVLKILKVINPEEV